MAVAVKTSGRGLWAVTLVAYLLFNSAEIIQTNSVEGNEIEDVSGRFFELECPLGAQNEEVQWVKDGHLIIASDAYREDRVFELRNGNLLVVDSKHSDSGMYTCTLGNGRSLVNHVDIQDSELEDVCGVKITASIRARVYGGDDTSEGEWPWMAMIRQTSTGQFCGGSLLDHFWVVTSAQCVRGISLTPQGTLVYLGKHRRELGESNEVEVEVEGIFVHPDYNDRTHDADIALIRLKSMVQFSDHIYPVCLPPIKIAEKIISNRRGGWATGWGRTENEHQLSHYLRKVKLKVTNQLRCEGGHSTGSITSNMFCADSDDHGRDTCAGDTGGPFVRKVGSRWYLVGIISWGVDCASHQPGVFTRVDKFHDWIRVTQKSVYYCNDHSSTSNDETSVEEILQSPISAEGCGLTDNLQLVPETSPWLVQILRRRSRRFGDNQDCNGVLIGDSWVMSLASCFQLWDRNQLSVRLTNSATQEISAHEIGVSNVVVHPSYNEYSRENDVVLLKLADSIGNTVSAIPACVLKPDMGSFELENQAQGFVTGIGNVNGLQAPVDDTIQTIPFAVNTTDSCNAIFYNGVTDSMFCATTMSANKDACGGFRGSPFVTQISGRWYVLGLVSWGHMCHVYPVVFSNIHNFNDWMLGVIENTGR